MIFNAKAIAKHLQEKLGSSTYVYHQILRAMEGNPHTLNAQELKMMKSIVKKESTKLINSL